MFELKLLSIFLVVSFLLYWLFRPLGKHFKGLDKDEKRVFVFLIATLAAFVVIWIVVCCIGFDSKLWGWAL